MYKGIPFSPQVALADGIGAGDTTIPVTDISAFPDAPNLATIGTDEDGETILYTAKTTDSLSGCTRGVEGMAKAWPSGTTIARNFTNKDFDALQKNIQEAKKQGLWGVHRGEHFRIVKTLLCGGLFHLMLSRMNLERAASSSHLISISRTRKYFCICVGIFTKSLAVVKRRASLLRVLSMRRFSSAAV